MKIINKFIKNHIVLCISFGLALLSCGWIAPDVAYIAYIDGRTLGILWMLMIIMAGFQKLGLFRTMGEALIENMSNLRALVIALVSLCFFTAMLMTNDVALLTFVPFTIVTLGMVKRKDLYIFVIVLETIAANLGSMLTPLGNPQNLYLYSVSHMKIEEFILLMLPYAMVAYAAILLCCIWMVQKKEIAFQKQESMTYTPREKCFLWTNVALFALALLVVLRVVDVRIGVLVCLLTVGMLYPKILKKADYGLLFTFVFLFIFIGNMKRIPEVSQFVSSLIQRDEILVSVGVSQVISNVPSAILCAGFTSNIEKIVIGTNIGGLGTLIASMASLISYNQYRYVEHADSKSYIKTFTLWNLVFLVLMLGMAFLREGAFL